LFLPGWAQSSWISMDRFQSICRRKMAFVSTRPGKETTPTAFRSPYQQYNSDPRLGPSGSNPTAATTRHEEAAGHEAQLAAREASNLRREVAAWRREVTAWRRASPPASTSRPSSTVSAGFSPVNFALFSFTSLLSGSSWGCQWSGVEIHTVSRQGLDLIFLGGVVDDLLSIWCSDPHNSCSCLLCLVGEALPGFVARIPTIGW
jgi:hypothetical protein